MQIFLQYCYSTILNIELYCSQYCKKKKKNYILLLLFHPKFLSHPSYFFLFSSLSSFFVLHLLCPLWSFIAEISHPSHTASLSSLIAQPLSHCTGAGFWIFEVGGWISVDRWARFGSLHWDRLMVGLDRLIGVFEMVDLLIGGWIVWVDHR